ncbi:aconitase X swivel domain-containing protein [Hyphococcus lacteus]|uniref:DUF126 domain-containing protein n=1 Tax=Hyphococcus lacteus TaxID=3143536 RepID=A0ABV3Z112_9PROT
MLIRAQNFTHGNAVGSLIALSAPLSLWGGFDTKSGKIIDQHHPQHGISIAQKIVAMPYARGSSSSSSALLEAARLGNAPAAFIMTRADPILTIGALLADEIYQKKICILVIPQADWCHLGHAKWANILPTGSPKTVDIRVSRI